MSTCTRTAMAGLLLGLALAGCGESQSAETDAAPVTDVSVGPTVEPEATRTVAEPDLAALIEERFGAACLRAAGWDGEPPAVRDKASGRPKVVYYTPSGERLTFSTGKSNAGQIATVPDAETQASFDRREACE